MSASCSGGAFGWLIGSIGAAFRFIPAGEGDDSDMANFETFVFKLCFQTWPEAAAASEALPAGMVLGSGQKCSGIGATGFKHGEQMVDVIGSSSITADIAGKKSEHEPKCSI